MKLLPPAVRAWGRAGLRFVFRIIRIAFILGLMALPLPVVAWVAVILAPVRRNLTTEVLRKK